MTTLEELEKRVAALEASEGDETLQPNYLSVDPTTGQVGATFTGLVNALGLNLPLGAVSAPPTQSRIRWLRQTDQANGADLVAYGVSGLYALLADSYALESNAQSGVQMSAVDDQNNVRAFVWVRQNNRGATSRVVVNAGGNQNTVIDESNNSDFPRLAGPTPTRMHLIGRSFRGYRAAALNLSPAVWTLMGIDSVGPNVVGWDPDGRLSGGGYTAAVTGKYWVAGNAQVQLENSPQNFVGAIFVNGAERSRGAGYVMRGGLAADNWNVMAADIIAVNAGENIQFGIFNSGGNVCFLNNTPSGSANALAVQQLE